MFLCWEWLHMWPKKTLKWKRKKGGRLHLALDGYCNHVTLSDFHFRCSYLFCFMSMMCAFMGEIKLWAFGLVCLWWAYWLINIVFLIFIEQLLRLAMEIWWWMERMLLRNWFWCKKWRRSKVKWAGSLQVIFFLNFFSAIYFQKHSWEECLCGVPSVPISSTTL